MKYFFFLLWIVFLLVLVYIISDWMQGEEIKKILPKLVAAAATPIPDRLKAFELTETPPSQRLNAKQIDALGNCNGPVNPPEYQPWQDWDALLPTNKFVSKERTPQFAQRVALDSLAPIDGDQAYCNPWEAKAPVVEGFVDTFVEWMQTKTAGAAPAEVPSFPADSITPQETDAQIFEPKKPLVPQDPVTKNLDSNPVFPYNEQDAQGRRETLPGSLPIAADFPASNRFDRQDAEGRKETLDKANELMGKLSEIRHKMTANPFPAKPLGPVTNNIPEAGKINPPKPNSRDNFVPSPEPVSQAMSTIAQIPANSMSRANPPGPVFGARFNPEADARNLGYGKANEIPTQPPGGGVCRFMNTPQCSPDYPYYTGASIGVEGGGQAFKCNGPDGAKSAEAVASIDNGTIQRVYVVNPGKGYALPPKVSVVGGGGSGANLESRLNPTTGEVVDIVIKDAGYGYHSTPVIELEGPGIADQCFLCCAQPNPIGN